VPIHELKVFEGRHYYTMDFIDGQPLDRLIAGRELTVRRGVEIMEKVSRAVGHAHAQGIVHRDLKPGNIIVAVGGEPKVTDFGLAKFTGPAKPGTPALTRTGFAMGTPEYMAPEQAAGRSKEVDARADVYALGCILYELLAGAPPFTGGTAVETLQRHLDDDPAPPSRSGARVSEDLETICLKCLEKEPLRRYRDAGALADDLRRFLDGEPVAARRASVGYVLRRKLLRHRVVAAVSAAALLALVALTAWYISSLRAGQRRTARERDRARAAQLEAEDQRVLAERRRREAEDARRAEAQALAAARTENARYRQELYVSGIGLAQLQAADANIAMLDAALAVCPPEMRHWEWGRLARDGHQDLGVLHRGEKELLALALSPDGRRLAWTGWDGAVRIRDQESGRIVMDQPAHGQCGYSLAWSPDGRRLASCGRDGAVKLWDPAAGRELWSRRMAGEVLGTFARMTAVVCSPDGQLVIYGAPDGKIHLLAAADGAPLVELPGPEGLLAALAVSPDGKLLASGGMDQSVVIWDLPGRKGLLRLTSGRGVAYALRFSPDNRWLAIGYDTGSIDAWQVEADKEGKRQTLRLFGHRDAVNWLDFNADGSRLASASRDRTVKVQQLKPERSELLSLKGHGREVSAAVFTRDGRGLLSAGYDGAVRSWDATANRSAVTLVYPEMVRYAAWSPDGRRIAAALDDRTVRFHDAATGREESKLEGHAQGVFSLAFSPDGRRLASADKAGAVKLWDLAAGKPFAEIPAHPGEPCAVAWSPDDRRVATGGGDKAVRIWDAASGARVHDLTGGHNFLVLSVAFSADGKLLASGGADGLAIVWDPAAGRLLHSLRSEAGPVNRVAFSPDGRMLAAATKDRVVQLWRLGAKPEDRPELLRTLRGHMDSVSCLAWSPDSRRLASGGGDFPVRIWDVAAGRELLSLAGHASRVFSIGFSPDGRRLLSSELGGVAFVWQTDDWVPKDRPAAPATEVRPPPPGEPRRAEAVEAF
jgi:WD40 repeat protein